HQYLGDAPFVGKNAEPALSAQGKVKLFFSNLVAETGKGFIDQFVEKKFFTVIMQCLDIRAAELMQVIDQSIQVFQFMVNGLDLIHVQVSHTVENGFHLSLDDGKWCT